jgi:hypothetical protein
MPFVVLVLGLIGGGMLALLALNTASAANEVRRHDIAEADQSVAAQVEQLQIDARNSAAPGNLARAAQALGMVPAGNPGFIELDRKGRVRVLGRPAPATAPPVYVAPTPTPPKHNDHQQKPDRTRHADRSHHTDTAGHSTKADKKRRDGAQGDNTGAHGKESRDSQDGRQHTTRHGTRHPNRHANPHAKTGDTSRAGAPATPTPTTTPTITLPGGDR